MIKDTHKIAANRRVDLYTGKIHSLYFHCKNKSTAKFITDLWMTKPKARFKVFKLKKAKTSTKELMTRLAFRDKSSTVCKIYVDNNGYAEMLTKLWCISSNKDCYMDEYIIDYSKSKNKLKGTKYTRKVTQTKVYKETKIFVY